MLKRGETVIVAVSGGPDSVALLHLLLQFQEDWKLRLHVAHLDHGLRGEDSKSDSEFVSQLAKRLDCPLTKEVSDVAQIVNEGGGSVEEKARQVRYTFLQKVAESIGATKIATGHHADDRAETVLMWLLRGAGPTGLRGIPPVRKALVVRPLIEVTRDEIEKYLMEQGLPSRHDSSNLDNRYFRNKIRNELLPLLRKEYSPHFVHHAGQLANLTEEEEDFFEKEVKRILPTLAKRQGTQKIILDIRTVLMYHLALRRRILRYVIRLLKGDLQDILYRHVQSLLDATDSDGTSRIIHLPGDIVAERTADALIMRKGKILAYDREVIAPGRTDLPEIEGVLITERMKVGSIPKDLQGTGNDTGYFDYEAMKGQLRLRPKRQGDAFQPLGMKGSKKLQDFFVDEKIPRLERQEIPLLTVGNDIAWVVGRRMAEKFKVTGTTKDVLKMDFKRLNETTRIF